ncbi:uncharacterized protein LOC119662140 [Teleopsis dalmanni]|uniref:uncharacterized protein LOC119662140 n=1 Tax=Teleopsis dalmanni TaxID=139649 RepID=UPI0018CD38CD|nr:uncharacterized protein LOC119662140 [Teleopsis dalmanni]
MDPETGDKSIDLTNTMPSPNFLDSMDFGADIMDFGSDDNDGSNEEDLGRSSSCGFYADLIRYMAVRRHTDKNKKFFSISSWMQSAFRIGLVSLALYWGYKKVKGGLLSIKWTKP